jgi:putative iron-regulated protein
MSWSAGGFAVIKTAKGLLGFGSVAALAAAGVLGDQLTGGHGIFAPVGSAFAAGGEGGEKSTGGEGGEKATGGEGGEAGAGVPDSYALNSTDPNAFAYDARPQIENYVALVEATYRASAADARLLEAAVDALLAAPSIETLTAARNAWLNARGWYLQTEAFRFYDGPIEAIEGRINAWPLNEAFIDGVEGAPDSGIINDPKVPLTIEAIDERDQVSDEADVTTGWHAIEFLLWGQDRNLLGPGMRPASDYLPGQGNNDRRRQYLKLVTDQLVGDLDSLAAAWDRGRADGYAARFLALPQREALGRIVNGLAILSGFEMMSERLAVALDSNDQEDEHSCFSDNTNADFVFNLRGIRNVWFGDVAGSNGPGLDALVAGQDPALAERLTGLINAADAALAAIDHPFVRVLAAPPGAPSRAEAEAAVEALAALATGLKEAGNRLGVLVLIPD